MMLLEDYHKMYVLLRSQIKWDNEKIFGKNGGLNTGGTLTPDFQKFSLAKLTG
jgi:hypothetical protein